jgi:hypothetical protein
MAEKTDKPLPETLDPSDLEEHGVTIPVPTPTGINIPNPWKPAPNGTPSADPPPDDPGPKTSSR